MEQYIHNNTSVRFGNGEGGYEWKKIPLDISTYFSERGILEYLEISSSACL